MVDAAPTGGGGQLRQILDVARRDFESRLGEPLTKACLPRYRIPCLAAAEEAEVAEAAIQKMLGGHAAYGRVVHVDSGILSFGSVQAISTTGRRSRNTALATRASIRWAIMPSGFHSRRGG